MPELPPPPPPPMSIAEAAADLVRRYRPPWATSRVVGGAAVATIVAIFLLGGPLRAPRAAPEVVLPVAGSDGDPGAAGPAAPPDGTVAVHAAGAFVHPGLYELPHGARVAQLVAAAGGAAPDAVVDALNLAARLNDGERIYLPRAGEAVAAGSVAGDGTGVVDLNTATLEQLDALPGIGPATAQAILDHRKTKGRFASVEDLLEVRGIGDAKLASLRDRVRV